MEQFQYFAAPLYVIALLIEYLLTKKKFPHNYPAKDTAASLSLGVGFLVVSAFNVLFVVAVFNFINKYSLLNIPSLWGAPFQGQSVSWAYLILLIFLEDLCFYIFHRVSHESRFWWCVHETHHSSQQYNYSTALRQPIFEGPTAWIFWVPLAFIGFKTPDILFQMSLNLFYQFWIHTKLTKSLGPLDYILNTPSHHRVHHGVNIPYLDKNYAGTFIIWDKLFKTFQPETETPRYGILHQLDTYNPLKITFHTFIELFKDMAQTPKISHKLKYFFGRPGWRHDGTGLTAQQMQEDYYLKSKS